MLTNGQLHISTGGVWAIIGHAQGSHHARKKIQWMGHVLGAVSAHDHISHFGYHSKEMWILKAWGGGGGY